MDKQVGRGFSFLKRTFSGCVLGGAVLTAALYTSNTYADFFVSSFGTNELMRFDEVTGEYLGVIAEIQGPFASQIGYEGDLFVSSHLTGEVLRYDSVTGEYKGDFISAGAGGLSSPTAPNFGSDGLVYVGDLASNTVLRYDAEGNFIDVFADGVTSDLNGPFMQTFDEDTMLIASGFTNSILRYDLKTKAYLGEFVESGSGGVQVPVGLEFGPDGNLYTSSSATNEIYRYDGRTGEFIDVFVPAGSGGMSSPRAIRFGGPNSDLYVISSDTNEILQYDRITGEFIGAVATAEISGMSQSRGLTFTPRPEVVVYSTVRPKANKNGFKKVMVKPRIKDFLDDSPKLILKSIEYSDPSQDIDDLVKGARIGKQDLNFKVKFDNDTDTEQYYFVTYQAVNKLGQKALATTKIIVPPKTSCEK